MKHAQKKTCEDTKEMERVYHYCRKTTEPAWFCLLLGYLVSGGFIDVGVYHHFTME
jgi:hypothetical protein